jgi:hypothetical protein
MQKPFLLTSFAFLVVLTPPVNAIAYVDPGTGSAVFGLAAYVIAGAGVAAAFVAGLLRKFRGAIFRTKRPEHAEAQEPAPRENEQQ